MQVKAILWDWDGTICDTFTLTRGSIQYAEKILGLPVSDNSVVDPLIGMINIRSVFNLLHKEMSENEAFFNEFYRKTEEFRIEHMNELTPFYYNIPKIINTIKEKTKIKQGLVTNRKMYTFRAFIEMHSDFMAKFDTIVTAGDMCSQRKPSTEPLELALKNMNVAPEQEGCVLMIGDTESDVKAANSLGNTLSVLVGWANQYNKTEELVNSAKIILNSGEQLLKILGVVSD